MAMQKVENKYLLDKNDLFELTTCEVVMYNPSTKMEYASASVKTDNLSKTESKTPVKAGIWNKTFFNLVSDTEVTFEYTDIKSDLGLEAQKFGGTLASKSCSNCLHYPTTYEITGDDTLTVTLPEEPNDSTEVAIYDLQDGKMLETTTDYTISGKTITIKKSQLKAGDSIKVTSYTYTKMVEMYEITGEQKPSVVSLFFRKPLFDANKKIVAFKQYYFPKAELSAEITLEGSSEQSEKTITNTLTITQGDQNFLGQVMVVPYGDVQV